MVNRKIAWFFNLDAEEELRHPGRHSRSPSMQRRMQSLATGLRAFAAPGDVVVEDSTCRLTPGFVGQAWCPTATARDRLRDVGAALPTFPALDVLRRVNHRFFNAALGQTLPGARWVDDATALHDIGDEGREILWLLKRPFGFSGRHRLRCRLPARAAHEQRWIEASFRQGDGLQVEPWVERQVDCVVHGWCPPHGDIRLGEVCVQDCDARGAWQRTRLATPQDLGPTEVGNLLQTAHEVAVALQAAGYFGPFGIDSFRWREQAGRAHWNPRCDINARYTMGWSVGMRGWRPDLTLSATA